MRANSTMYSKDVMEVIAEKSGRVMQLRSDVGRSTKYLASTE
jgi:hypothetical protein